METKLPFSSKKKKNVERKQSFELILQTLQCERKRALRRCLRFKARFIKLNEKIWKMQGNYFRSTDV